MKRKTIGLWIVSFWMIALMTSPVWVSPICADELSAFDVMKKADERYDGDTSSSEMTMILIDKRNNQRVRKIKGFTKDYGKDEKSINFFLSPADVRNTAFLTYDWDDENKEDDNWLYLPALRKIKRISSGNKKDSFMGSDFSYADMNGLEITDWQYRFVKTSDVGRWFRLLG